MPVHYDSDKLNALAKELGPFYSMWIDGDEIVVEMAEGKREVARSETIAQLHDEMIQRVSEMDEAELVAFREVLQRRVEAAVAALARFDERRLRH